MDEYISKEQFYKMAHISKSNALRLIQTGLVPAIDTGKPTNRYLIKLSDVEFYLHDRDEHPDKNGRIQNELIQCVPSKYKKTVAKKIRIYATRLWKDVPSLLTIEEASALIGYSPRLILSWTRTKGLKRLEPSNQIFIAKKHLLEFIESKDFHERKRKSRQHLDLIRSAGV